MTTSPRRLAMATGAKTYQPDGPCRYGHVAPRYTSGKQCLACVAERRKPARPPPDDALLAMLAAHPGCTALELSVLLDRPVEDVFLALGGLHRLGLAKSRKGRWYACVEGNRLREAKRVQRDRPRARPSGGFALQNHWMR